MGFHGIAYEPHPVSPERKKELNGQGLKVVDARFAPDGLLDGALRQDGPTVAEYVAAGYRAANYPPNGYASRSTAEEIAEAINAQIVELPTREDIAAMPKAEVVGWLEAHGVEKPEGAVADLRDKLAAILFVEV